MGTRRGRTLPGRSAVLAVISRLAVGGYPAYAAIRQQADDLERSACEVEARPASFWRRREAG